MLKRLFVVIALMCGLLTVGCSKSESEQYAEEASKLTPEVIQEKNLSNKLRGVYVYCSSDFKLNHDSTIRTCEDIAKGNQEKFQFDWKKDMYPYLFTLTTRDLQDIAGDIKTSIYDQDQYGTTAEEDYRMVCQYVMLSLGNDIIRLKYNKWYNSLIEPMEEAKKSKNKSELDKAVEEIDNKMIMPLYNYTDVICGTTYQPDKEPFSSIVFKDKN